MTKKKKARRFLWTCGAYFEVRLVRGDRTKMEYRRVRGTHKFNWIRVPLDKAIAFAYGANIPTKDLGVWTPLGDRTLSDMEQIASWRSTTYRALEYLGVVSR